MIAPRRKKMKPQPRFKALAGIFYRGYYAGISRRLLVFQSICGERRFASCRVRKTVKRSAHNPYSGLFGNSRQTRVSNLAIAPNMQLRAFGKILNPAFQIDRPQAPIFSFLRLFKLSYLHRLYGHQRANCEKIPQWGGAFMDLSRAWRALRPSAKIAGTVSPNGKRPARAACLRCGTFLASGQICGLRKSRLNFSPHRAPHCPLRFFTRGTVFEPRDCPSRDFPQI